MNMTDPQLIQLVFLKVQAEAKLLIVRELAEAAVKLTGETSVTQDYIWGRATMEQLAEILSPTKETTK